MADDLVQQLIDASGATANRDVLRDILRTAAGSGRRRRRPSRPEDHRRRAARRCAPPSPCSRRCEDAPKVTIFGSARTGAGRPALRSRPGRSPRPSPRTGWMVITGAGPGIMEAGAEGAGPDRAIGVSIRLPFEEAPSDILAGGERLVAMKYFFTRKLMLIKESSAFVCLPGGFGTQDETFELLTLLQTGQGAAGAGGAARRPRRHLLDALGRLRRGGARRRAGLISAQDHELFLVTDDVDQAVRRDPALLAQLPLDPLGRRPPGDPAAPRTHRRGARRPQRPLRRPAGRRRHRAHRPAPRRGRRPGPPRPGPPRDALRSRVVPPGCAA